MNNYRINVLRNIMAADEKEGGYGARLRYGDKPQITIDAEAMQALIDHFQQKAEMEAKGGHTND